LTNTGKPSREMWLGPISGGSYKPPTVESEGSNVLTEQKMEAVKEMILGLNDDQIKEACQMFKTEGRRRDLAHQVRELFQHRGWSRAESEKMAGFMTETNPANWRKMLET
jgi:hypothetical protein